MENYKIKIAGYQVDILIQGFPGASVHHGGLGWSTVVLVRHKNRVALVDTGSFGMRRLLVKQLAQCGVTPADITDLLLTHSHFDHIANWTLFPKARIVIGTHELQWAADEPWGETPVPELYVQKLLDWPTLQTVEDCGEVFPGITARMASGHTPGHLIFVLGGPEHDVIFVGDAAKTRAELVSRKTNATYDPAASSASIGRIWELWAKRAGSIVVPGHDLPMVLQDGKCEYCGRREAAIKAWFGQSLEAITLYDLTVDPSDRELARLSPHDIP